MQRARLQAQSDARQRLWEHGLATRAPAALAAAAALRTIHTIGNNAKTSLLVTLVLFKVLLRPLASNTLLCRGLLGLAPSASLSTSEPGYI